jgi:type IV pilus assembly protein PilB
MGRVHIGQILKSAGHLDDAQIQSALGYQRIWGVRLGEALIRLRMVEEDTLLAALGRQLGVRVVRIGDARVAPEVLAMVPERVIRRCRALPLELEARAGRTRLVVAFAAPDDLRLVDEVEFAAGLDVTPVLAGDEDLGRAITRHLHRVRLDGHGLRPLESIELPDEPTDPMRLVGRAPRYTS